MAYETGKSKSLDDITLDDALKYPIWEWALDAEGAEGQDETWQRPITDPDNVTDEIYEPIITLKVKGTELFGSAQFDNESQSLLGISVWVENHWQGLNEVNLPIPITFISIPRIDGIQNVEFVCRSLTSDTAERVGN